jgi:hypothetical protein
MSNAWENICAEPRWGALSSIHVLDLTVALAGPYCTQLLADQGACVLKVEPPGGDMMRVVPPMFEAANRNKLGVVIDLKSDAGRAALLELVDGADVLVENFRVGVMDRLGLSYEVLSERNPRLVYAAIRGFGDPRTGGKPLRRQAVLRRHRPSGRRPHIGDRHRYAVARRDRHRRHLSPVRSPRSESSPRCTRRSKAATASSSTSAWLTACLRCANNSSRSYRLPVRRCAAPARATSCFRRSASSAHATAGLRSRRTSSAPGNGCARSWTVLI